MRFVAARVSTLAYTPTKAVLFEVASHVLSVGVARCLSLGGLKRVGEIQNVRDF